MEGLRRACGGTAVAPKLCVHSLARASILSVSFSEAVIPDQGTYGTLRRVCGNRVLGPSLHVLILLPQVGVGVARP